MLAEVTFDAEHQKQTQIEQESFFFSCSNVFALQWTWKESYTAVTKMIVSKLPGFGLHI